MATFYTYDREECYEVQGSYNMTWGNPAIEQAQIPIGDDVPSGLLKKLYDFFEAIDNEHHEVRAALNEKDPGFYKNRNSLYYLNHEWYEFVAQRNADDDFFEPGNLEIDEENGIVSFDHGSGYLELTKEESEEVLELYEWCKKEGDAYREELIREGKEVDEDVIEDYWRYDQLGEGLRELSYGAGCIWYTRNSLDQNKLTEHAKKINEDLQEIGYKELLISDELLG